MSAVSLAGIGKIYNGKIEAVHDVSFTLNPGETVALVGHNGAGKTTLMKMMLGLIRPTSGTLSVLGDDPAAGQFAARRNLGYLPENVSFNSALTGKETLAFYARLKQVDRSCIGPVLEQVGLSLAANRRVGTYSKGMRQRLGLAQALVGEPKVLLLDEPTTGLDPALRQHFYEILDRLRERGATILLSSHALTELEERAGRVIIMNRGIMVADGDLDALRRIAQLPTSMKIAVQERKISEISEALHPFGQCETLPSGHLAIKVSGNDKMAVLRLLAAQDRGVTDIDTVPPTLDELYAHFLLSQEDAA